MNQDYLDYLTKNTLTLKEEGLYKAERVICSPQQAKILAGKDQVINLCANNYLGLANDPDLIHAASQALQKYGYGMSSVRFICGTQDIHKIGRAHV